MDLQFTLLAWIDNWGPTTGWAIRIGLAVVGGALCLIGIKAASSTWQEPAA